MSGIPRGKVHDEENQQRHAKNHRNHTDHSFKNVLPHRSAPSVLQPFLREKPRLKRQLRLFTIAGENRARSTRQDYQDMTLKSTYPVALHTTFFKLALCARK